MNLQLDKRDQIVIVLGAMAILLVTLMAFYVPTGPKKKYEASMQRLESLVSDLQEQQSLRIDETVRVQSQQALLNRLEARPASFDFFAFVQTLLTQSGLGNNSALEQHTTRGGTEKQPMVRVELEGVSLEQLVDFLHRMYASENLVGMYQMSRLRPAKNNKGLDCDLVLITIEKQ